MECTYLLTNFLHNSLSTLGVFLVIIIHQFQNFAENSKAHFTGKSLLLQHQEPQKEFCCGYPIKQLLSSTLLSFSMLLSIHFR